MRRIVARAVAYAAVVLALSLAAVLSIALDWRYQGNSDPVVIYIEPGTSSRSIARELESQGVVASHWLFLAVRALRPRDKLMAGEYRFALPISAWRVFDRISSGQVEYHPFTIPEGYNRFEIAQVLAEHGFVESEAFLAECSRAERVRDLFPDATSLEGFLFPDTYHVSYPFSAPQIVNLMVQRFRTVFGQITQGTTSNLSTGELVTLASMIEKETGVGSERGLVSSVFHNRLRRGMLLQCDPTVIYGLILEDRYRGQLLRAHLDEDHPYNTYVHAGLPPGPIANPGRDSLQAALRPADSAYLFFVAEGNGSGAHVFSENFQAHTRAVGAYRRSRSQ